MDKIYDALETADALVIGAPAYFGSYSAQLKLLIDRSNCLADMITLPNGKNPEHALVSIRIWCKYFANIELVDTLVSEKTFLINLFSLEYH